MSGKSKNVNRWGGVRPGSGRKPAYMLTDNQIKAMLRTARKKAKVEGKTLDDILLEIIYNTRAFEIELKSGKKKIELAVPTKERLAAIKLFKEFTMSKHSEKDINIIDARGPKVGLPEMKPDPAKLISIEGGKKK